MVRGKRLEKKRAYLSAGCVGLSVAWILLTYCEMFWRATAEG